MSALKPHKHPVDWRPIETAPTNVAVLIARSGSIMMIAMFESDGAGGMGWYDICGSDLRGATHWHPLPDPLQGEECE